MINLLNGIQTGENAVANRNVLQSCAVLGAFYLLVSLAGYLYMMDWSQSIPRDASTLLIGRDFVNLWMYGVAATQENPERWYDFPTYQQALIKYLGVSQGLNWSYPPTIMLVAAPFGLMGYLPALLAWTVLGLSLYAVFLSCHFSDRLAYMAGLCAPAAVFGLISGQSALITAVILTSIFTQLDRRPWLAGLLIGLLTIKPQLGLLFPVLLVASCRWRVFSAATITTLVLAGLSILFFGLQPWIDFMQKGIPTQNMVLMDPDLQVVPFYPTIFINLHGAGLDYSSAMTVQAVVALAAVGGIFWAFRSRANANPRLLAAFFLAASVAAVPYLLIYDTLALALAALLLLEQGELDKYGRLLARLVFWLPLLQVAFGLLHIPGPALIAPAFAFYLAQQLRHMPMPKIQREET